MPTAWFKPKRFGYGATPVNWQGWVASTVFALVLGGLGLVFAVLARSQASPIYLVACVGAILLVTVGFMRLARARTEGEWRWRWGREADRYAPIARGSSGSQL
jgi:hypothetical protein